MLIFPASAASVSINQLVWTWNQRREIQLYTAASIRFCHDFDVLYMHEQKPSHVGDTTKFIHFINILFQAVPSASSIIHEGSLLWCTLYSSHLPPLNTANIFVQRIQSQPTKSIRNVNTYFPAKSKIRWHSGVWFLRHFAFVIAKVHTQTLTQSRSKL